MEDHSYNLLTAQPDPTTEPQGTPPCPLFDRRPLTLTEWFVIGTVVVVVVFAGFVVLSYVKGWQWS